MATLAIIHLKKISMEHDEITLKELNNRKLNYAIKLTIDQEALFKLFSYRIVSPEYFIENTEKNIQIFAESCRKATIELSPELELAD